MNYSIKKSFKASDLQVGDLMYDALNDVMVRVAFVSETIQKKVTELKIESGLDFLLSSTKTTDIQLKQFVLENIEDKSIFMVDVIGKDGKLPLMENNKPRFRHLMRSVEAAPIINWPLRPNCPSCPNYPYPNYPYYPYYTWNTTDVSDATGTITITTDLPNTIGTTTNTNVNLTGTITNTNVDLTNIRSNTNGVLSTNMNINNESKVK